MSLKQEIETWVQALAHYDNNEFDAALKVFDGIADTSRILFNCGVIHATLGEHEKAVECYQRAITCDNYLAIAYFQEGVSNFLLGDFEEALANFNDTLLYLRGNTSIDYEQLGLKFRLYSCEVLFNRGLCYIYLQQIEPGMQDLQYAKQEKVTADHDVIDEAIREQADGYTVFSIPVGVIYRPNEAKVKNLKTKDYLGKARLVAASDRNNAFTGFQGSEQKKALAAEAIAKDDRPAENISFGATNLVHKGLSSRSRQQKSEKGNSGGNNNGGLTQRAASVRAGPPPRLNLERPGAAGSNGQTGGDMPSMGKTRVGTSRTASEPRGPPSRQYSGSSGRPRLYGETTGNGYGRITEDGLAEEVYEMYISPRSTGTNRSRAPKYIDEENEYTSEYEDDTIVEGEFEMMAAPAAEPETKTARSSISQRSAPRRGSSRKPEIRKFRVKVHAKEETRYIMISASIDFGELEGKIRDKFRIPGLLRIRMRDDGDMITMGDQDDLDLLLSVAKDEARRENQEMGKMEIWVEEKK
ncbi:putative PB1 domain protein [Talaromyces proteolyticus]|uniref:PB1 domain protein n=1 Tax=Talaromyces proteolyticus TaxID=1131652 RepID=A0AAD4Q507_9EURO|nr:putative PB1 domain protein [Talaromyces proteolyticus]KAH8703669.1 putative PB1 domain protein [Talaromyces proteolyticus]